jgi:predicted DNA-binding transcriptional regulator
MNIFSAFVAIAAIYGVVRITQYWFESRKAAPPDHARMDELERELRERIETLERIVTDQREQLKRQIDEL